MSFTIKKGDRLPAYTATLTDSDGNAIDLTGCTVLFLMSLMGSTTVKVNAAATIVSATDGTVSYSWGATDTDTAGLYRAEFEITVTASGLKRTVPAGDFYYVQVITDIA